MQQITYCFGITTPFIPLYHSESNPVERKNREFKTQLAILVQDHHSEWDHHLSSIRFAINSTCCDSTGYSPSFLTFGREIRAPYDPVYDLRKVIDAENFIPRITPYLKKLATTLSEAMDRNCKKQDVQKTRLDSRRRPAVFKKGDKVLLKSHTLSSSKSGFSSKLAPKRDGPYMILRIASPTTYELGSCTNPPERIGRYHAADLSPFVEGTGSDTLTPLIPKRRRGRPKKNVSS
ncbi:hypothetical protein Zmor_017885 [Zophobas morio]|uniref:Integrase catalytic domain-containing protein n=1 Tax=Zophobas morio TaxID=2755281 RepID=A0AA38MD66_9CUCU|nr:hypothetical protein Zmor_017885 [Zophobas morio]